jgi:hypothetical protein
MGVKREHLNKEELKRILADEYKKRDAISREIDSIEADPRERRSRRYLGLIYSQDLVTKRIIDLETRLSDDTEEDSDLRKLNDLFALIEFAHKYMEKEESQGDKKLLLTSKDASISKTRKFSSPSILTGEEKELERLLEKKRRLFLRKKFA